MAETAGAAITAQALSSGCLETGQAWSCIRAFTSQAWSWVKPQCMGKNTLPLRILLVIFARAVRCPRRELTAVRAPSLICKTLASSGWISSSGSGCMVCSRFTLPVRVIVCHCPK